MKRLITRSALVVAVTLLAGPSYAAPPVKLVADQFQALMPDGTLVTMWGFGLDTGPGSTVSAPGPRITVLPGDPSLTIILRNELPVPVSLVIPSLTGPTSAGPSPTWIDIAGSVVGTGTRPAANYDARIRSIAAEAAPTGGIQTYTWPNVRPGTHMYQSGTQPQVQVQMGLYGAVTKDFGAAAAYSGVAYDKEVIVFYSEIDPALHAAVASGVYGSPAFPSTIDYDPKYFLVNGAPYPTGTAAHPAATSERVLIRFLNGGLRTLVPALQDQRMDVVAEDGFQYNYPRNQYSVRLAAGKTKDAVVVPTSASMHAILDRSLNLTDSGLSGGGVLAYLDVGAGVPPPLVNTPPVAVDDAYTVAQDGVLNVAALVGVLGNDSDADLDPLTAVQPSVPTNGTLTLNLDGSFTYTPNALFNGIDSFTYRARDAAVNSAAATVTITVTALPNTPPVAVIDTYSVAQDGVLNVAATGVLGNDTDAELDPLTAVLPSVPTNGTLTLNLDGSFTYTPNALFNGTDSFTYLANDGTANSLTPATVTITVTAAPVNAPPVAMIDTYSVAQDGVLNVAAPGVLGNDTDADLDPLTAVLPSVPTNGTLVLNTNGSFTYTPNALFNGPDSFTYLANDGTVNSVAPATVTITVTAAPPPPPTGGGSPPMAKEDEVQVAVGTSIINVLANDTDPDGDLNPATVTIVRQPTGGALAVAELDGTVTFTATQGEYKFFYTVGDFAGNTSRTEKCAVKVE